MDAYQEKQGGLVPVFVVAVIAALLYSWIMTQRWVTPDEGAHMMSAWRIHYGEVPLVDYGSRQPLYTYIHAFSQLFFGNTLFAGRIISLFSTLFAGLLIFLIGRTVQGEVVGTVAATLFLFSPLTLEFATVVQTQPVVILFECAAVLILLTRERGGWLALAGALLACAFYVRESSMAVVLAALLWLFFMRGGSRALLRQGIPFIAGYVAVALVVILFYSQWLSVSELWHSPINPLQLGVEAILKFLPSASAGNGIETVSAGALEGMEMVEDKTAGRPPSVTYLLLGAQFISMILVAAAGAVILRLRSRKREGDESKFWFLLFWLFLLAALYSYQFKSRGFFPGYLREFEPALAILAAIGLTGAVYKIGVSRARVLLLPVIAIVLIPLAVVTGQLPFWVEDFTLAVCSGFAVLMLLCVGDLPWRKALLPLAVAGVILGILFILRRTGGPMAEATFAGLFLAGVILVVVAGMLLRWSGVENIGSRLLLGATAFGLSLSIIGVAEKGGFDFHGPWPIPVVIQVAQVIEENTEPDDEVMSGGVIWSYLADRYPYMKQDHPLGFYNIKINSAESEKFYQNYLIKPPAIVVLDGQTQKTWYKSSRLKAAVENDYIPLLEVGAKSAVVVLIHRSKRVQ